MVGSGRFGNAKGQCITNLDDKMLGQAGPNSITQVIIHNIVVRFLPLVIDHNPGYES